MMRAIFSDGWNSYYHVVFGILAHAYDLPMIGTLFTMYQVVFDWGTHNFSIDMLEFVFGVILAEVADWKLAIS